MPDVLDISNSAKRISRATGSATSDGPTVEGFRCPARLLPIAGGLLLYIAGLVVAVPLGDGAIVVTLIVVFVIALFIGAGPERIRGPRSRRCADEQTS